ncbi:copper amine oxidase N-terminal domain-containing protein [Paenibacillus sp. MAH-36]|uniref:Copper amine oxidase N-terminal domain-containing protein n=1 Tax=Paenibacillus violae TaxID=3077234 RepID=A0ABU3RPD2_9BACL|nr:copper amine oxidase N-terminal domain-containing protein [Paenibacillus sp. PFR10]MDU0205839.1 copper amine oxidase N-terminal domain-containing protein [Paenibacillus sp. PFR10]
MSKIYYYFAGLFFVISLFIISPGNTRAEDNPIRVTLDANPVEFSAPPFIENPSTLVQFRPVFERLGLDITWDANTRTITGHKQDIEIELQIDNPIAKVNGKLTTLSVAPKLREGNTFVPLRFISESVGAKVEWNEALRNVVIYSKKEYASIDAKFRFTAYGLWRNMTGVDQMQPEVKEKVQDFVTVEDIENIQLAIRYFNFTMLFISTEQKVNDTKDMTLIQYLDRAKEKGAILKDDIIDEKQVKLFGFDAVQLTYVNRHDWDKRIDTLIIFKSGVQFYSVRNSSYEVTYKSSIQDFQSLLESMKFNDKK